MKQLTRASQIYTPGVRTFYIPPAAQRTFARCAASFTREMWPDGVPFTQSDGNVAQNVVLVVMFEKTVDDVQWTVVGGAPFVGGVRLLRDGSELLTSSVGVQFAQNGVAIAQPGDLRVVIRNLVTLRTAATLTLFEEGE